MWMGALDQFQRPTRYRSSLLQAMQRIHTACIAPFSTDEFRERGTSSIETDMLVERPRPRRCHGLTFATAKNFRSTHCNWDAKVRYCRFLHV